MDVLNLLDYGYVKLVESWGSDERIIEAARMSTGKGFLGWGPMCKECSAKGLDSPVELDGTSCERCGNTLQHGDEKLLAYLWNNAHHTPFEMAGLSIEVQAPIFVFREWHRHRVPFSYNEASARYAPLPAIDYIPSIECATRVDAGSKQSAAVAGAPVFTVDDASEMRRDFADHFARTEALYQEMAESRCTQGARSYSANCRALLKDARERESTRVAELYHASRGTKCTIRDSRVRPRRAHNSRWFVPAYN